MPVDETPVEGSATKILGKPAESAIATSEAGTAIEPNREDDRLAEPVDTEQPPRLPFPVVGIGASAGGLEAFIEFFKVMPGDSGIGCGGIPPPIGAPCGGAPGGGFPGAGGAAGAGGFFRSLNGACVRLRTDGGGWVW